MVMGRELERGGGRGVHRGVKRRQAGGGVPGVMNDELFEMPCC